MNEAICNFADEKNLANALRLHYYYGPDSLIQCIDKNIPLICADTENRLSYDLDQTEADMLWEKRSLNTNGRRYLSTDVRIENHILIERELQRFHNRDTLIIFTHEWALSEQSAKSFLKALIYERTLRINALNRSNLHKAVKWLYDNNYEFSFL